MFFYRAAQCLPAIADKLIGHDFAIHIEAAIIQRTLDGCELG